MNSEEDKQRYFDMIENNDNISKTTDGKEFLILVGGVIALCIGLFVFADFFAGIYIDNMSADKQIKLEKSLSTMSIHPQTAAKNKEFKSQLETLENLKSRIIRLDKRLSDKSKFDIEVYPDDEVNAFVIPDGSIYFTKGLLKEVKDEQTLAFVLAHEMGHYLHRDHLKSFGREIITGAILTVVTAGQHQQFGSFVNDIHEVSKIVYSRSQETNADLYANEVVLKLYGNNDGALKFMEMIDEKQKLPEFLHYFSTHPSPHDRIYLLKQDAKKRGF